MPSISRLYRSAAVTLSLLALGCSVKADAYDMTTALMETTFRVIGTQKSGERKAATAFILAKPDDKKPGLSRYILVTAAHVLNDIVEDEAVLDLRKQVDVNEWTKFRHQLPIRNHGKPLWTKHPDADVAVMYVTLPTGPLSRVLSTTILADDEDIEKYEVHPGDSLITLGFPYGISAGESEAFPILRGGKIASYPLLPTRKRKKFLLDVEMFGGNSGGPVYLVDSNRTYQKATHLKEVQILIGIAVAELSAVKELKSPEDKPTPPIPLNMAEVIHASLIKDTIALLP